MIYKTKRHYRSYTTGHQPLTSSLSRLIFPTLIVLLLFPLLAACVPAAVPEESEKPLSVAWSLFPGWYPIILAAEQGYFAAEGVAVDLVFYDLYINQTADLLAGSVDGGLFAFGDALLMAGRYTNSTRVVAVTDRSTGADGILAIPGVENSAAGLRGLTIGADLGSFSELLVQEMLKAKGLKANEITLVNIYPEDALAVMPDKVQVAHIWEPLRSEALALGYQEIFSSAEVPGLITDVIVFRREIVETRPSDVQGFVNAWFRAVEYWNNNPEEGDRIIAEYVATITGMTVEEALSTVSRMGVEILDRQANQLAFVDEDDMGSLYESGRVNGVFMTNSGLLNNEPDLGMLLDVSFINPGAETP
ncbi:MAG: ABC transporter substrate-binding protein [Anaerolineae bacterium]|nr:ABC transporter substrate-binding protein [Anaerolineae bacterium]